MVFDPVAWARGRGVRAGAPDRTSSTPDLHDEEPEVDHVSLLAEASAETTAAALEARLRSLGLTLGLFPEAYERASLGELVAADAPGAGATGPGFASLVEAKRVGRLVLRVQPRPAAQAGRGLAFGTFADGVEALRVLAQSGDVPEIALLADEGAAAFWLALAGLEPKRGTGALLVVIAAGAAGAAAARVASAVDLVGDRIVADLGQNVARAYAGARYDAARHTATLAAAGYSLQAKLHPARWSELLAVRAAALPAGGLVGTEVVGATPHGARVLVRTLRARRAVRREPASPRRSPPAPRR
jgi:alkyldihydroxyacetonephosphate synthase